MCKATLVQSCIRLECNVSARKRTIMLHLVTVKRLGIEVFDKCSHIHTHTHTHTHTHAHTHTHTHTHTHAERERENPFRYERSGIDIVSKLCKRKPTQSPKGSRKSKKQPPWWAQ